MIITPAEHDVPLESSDVVELLIKEARRKARRRRLTVGVILLAVLTVVVVLLVGDMGGRTAPKKTSTGDLANTVTSVSPTCLRSQVRVAFVGDGAGLGHGASVIQVTNASGKACSLTGYPRFTGVFASGVQRIAKDTVNGYIGGLGTNPVSRAKPPVVTLRARHGIASSMEEADANGSGVHPTCPGFTKYVISLPHVTGGTYTFRPRWPDLYCFQLEVHPFVPGSTGSAK